MQRGKQGRRYRRDWTRNPTERDNPLRNDPAAMSGPEPPPPSRGWPVDPGKKAGVTLSAHWRLSTRLSPGRPRSAGHRALDFDQSSIVRQTASSWRAWRGNPAFRAGRWVRDDGGFDARFDRLQQADDEIDDHRDRQPCDDAAEQEREHPRRTAQRRHIGMGVRRAAPPVVQPEGARLGPRHAARDSPVATWRGRRGFSFNHRARPSWIVPLLLVHNQRSNPPEDAKQCDRPIVATAPPIS